MISQMLKNRKKLVETWSESVDHNIVVKWVKNLQSEVNVTREQDKVDMQQEKVDISKESLKKILVECRIGSHQVQT